MQITYIKQQTKKKNNRGIAAAPERGVAAAERLIAAQWYKISSKSMSKHLISEIHIKNKNSIKIYFFYGMLN